LMQMRILISYFIRLKGEVDAAIKSVGRWPIK
jgi:hypothetical protein